MKTINIMLFMLLTIISYSQEKRFVIQKPEIQPTAANVLSSTKSINNPDNDTLRTSKLAYNFCNNGSNYAVALRFPPDGVSQYGSTQYLVYQDGLIFGGIIDANLTVVGTHFSSSMIPGKLSFDEGDDRQYRNWNYRTDWQSLPEGELKTELQYEYENWPVDLGAPFHDVNGDGQYTPYLDSPKQFGDEYVWFVMNDGSDSLAQLIFKNGTIGLEVSCVTYVYHNNPLLENVVFRKYWIVNNNRAVNNFHIGYWSDFDIGMYDDDFVGCDTTLNLGIGYNGEEEDYDYDDIPPAVGYLLLEGPLVDGSESDSGYYNGKWINKKRNLGMTSFAPIHRYGEFYFFGIGRNGTEWYNNLRGRMTLSGELPIDPHTGKETCFALSGDPVNGIGWYEGEGWLEGRGPGGRRLMINTGDIQFEPGDTIEVTYAIIAAQGTDRLNSVKLLKENAQFVRDYYYNLITDVKQTEEVVNVFSLSQNYPNPFNPTTTIKYTIPCSIDYQSVRVHLKIYDILGSEIVTLVNEQKKPGFYEVEFNGESLPSGTYFYRLIMKNFSETRKMILIK